MLEKFESVVQGTSKEDVWPETNENESDKWSTSTTFSENSSDDERTNTPLRDEVKGKYFFSFEFSN